MGRDSLNYGLKQKEIELSLLSAINETKLTLLATGHEFQSLADGRVLVLTALFSKVQEVADRPISLCCDCICQ